jgi:hypothetical protein
MNVRFYAATLAVLIGFAVAGCAGTGAPTGPTIANPPSQAVAIGHPITPTLRVKAAKKASYKRALYVLNRAASTVQILTNTYYRQLGTISYGLSSPEAETIDKSGNLYVSNHAYPYGYIAEYAPGANSPSYTYKATFPQGVAVDRHGNVFVADNTYYGGMVRQYAQGVKNPIASCSAPDTAFGVAVDANGNVFVSAFTAAYFAVIYEFSGGFSNCNSTRVIALGLYDPGPSLALDANGNLIVPLGSNVDVIAPPYSAVTATIGSGFSSVTGVSLNKTNKWLYVSDSGTNTVTVLNYQTNTIVKQLGVSNGISRANGVADAPNYVP